MDKKTIKLDRDEREILKAIDRGEYVSAPMSKKEMNALRLAARNTLLKNKTISIRISERDLLRLKARATEEGLPYQTLITLNAPQIGEINREICRGNLRS